MKVPVLLPALRGPQFAAALLFLAASGISPMLEAVEITNGTLTVQGSGLRVVTISATTAMDVPAQIQTEFAGRQGDQAPLAEGIEAVGELTGPGIDSPIRLTTTPGHAFQVPGLSREGIYLLQNVRLMRGAEFLQPATPGSASITVTDALKTTVRVRQLTAEEIRSRGIQIDARNYDVFEYTFSFIINGNVIDIPYAVIIDPRTHEVAPVAGESPYTLPPVTSLQPPRWSPPATIFTELVPFSESDELPTPPEEDEAAAIRPSIPAAIIIPNNFAVLHQFFAVGLMITNGAPLSSGVTLTDLSATMRSPSALRPVQTTPAVAFGQAVPIVDSTNGITFLVAQGRGEAEWVMEGLKPGNHTLEIEIRATFKSPGQRDIPLRAVPRASIVVHDPRFNLTFSHPETVRKGIDYSTFSFVTNLSPITQVIKVRHTVPLCSQNPAGNVCRPDGTPDLHELTIPAGDMRTIEYKLRAGVTGSVFATAGTVDGEALTASVQLHMGVSTSGIPLSPSTLLMPHYAQYVDPALVSGYLELLGLGYSLATAPLTQATASRPRVIRTDVFQRAVDIARAGQRIFIGEERRVALSGLLLDLLGNSVELREWDQLRREEPAARRSSAAVFRSLETEALSSNRAVETFVDELAGAQAWRSPFFLALVEGPAVSGQARPWAVSLRGRTSGRNVDQPNEAGSGWSRSIPFADLSRFNSAAADRYSEMAVIGRWTEDVDLILVPAATGSIPVHLVYPSPTAGSVFVAHFTVNAVAGETLRLRVERGRPDIAIQNAAGVTTATATATLKAADALRVVAARQDLHLDGQGHKVSVLFNRPSGSAVAEDFLPRFHGEVIFNRDGINYRGARPISAVARQENRSIFNLTFNHVLSSNAQYSLQVDPLTDPLSGAPAAAFAPISIRIDNDRPASILFGKVLNPAGQFVGGADVSLSVYNSRRPVPDAPQYDRTLTSDGSFLFESVSRDVEDGYSGSYRLSAVTPAGKQTSLAGVVRVPGKVHLVNLLFLGRGSAEGFVRYDSGAAIPGARVVAGSTMFNQFREALADARGFFRIENLPVGPLTFSATDQAGNVGFAAAEIQGPGQILKQDLSIFRRPFPGLGTVRGVVRRSDTNGPVSGAQVGVFSQGFGLENVLTDAAGRFEFRRVPSGFVTVLAADWSISRESAAADFDLATDEVRDLVLDIRITPPAQTGNVEGDVLIEDPLWASTPAKYRAGANAIVRIAGGQTVIADANGHFVFEGLPLSIAGKRITAHDSGTGRSGEAILPSLDPTRPVIVPILIPAAGGVGNIRVRLLSASGAVPNGYRVIDPGIPPIELASLGSGVFELRNVPVGRALNLWAVPALGGSVQQFVSGTARVEFSGHVAALTLRLPGQGTVQVKLRGDIDVVGDVSLAYQVWDEATQHPITRTLTSSTLRNGQAGFAEFTNIPALSNFKVSSEHPVYGKQSAIQQLGFDGEVRLITLQLNRLSTIRGTVFEADGRTPVPNASVRLEDGTPSAGGILTQADGTFEFRNVPSNVSYRIVAEISRNNLFRTGFAGGSTPPLGGSLENVSITLRRQGSVEGRVVYAQFKRYDPSNSSNNLPDDTPGDLSDNAPVPMARFFLRELDFPARSFGTQRDPLVSDATGRFSIGNVFEGPLRITAQAAEQEQLRSDWTGRIRDEGEVVTAIIAITTEAVGPATITVVDPNQGNAPVANAEVTLIRMSGGAGSPFDFGTTDGNGVIQFERVPVGQYVSSGYAKTLGRSGSSLPFDIAAESGGTARVILSFSGAIEGKLSDPQAGGRGVPGAHVDLSAFAYETRTSTGSGGEFLFNGVREGIARLSARDPLSNRRASASRSLSQLDPRPFVALELEAIETLFLSVFLPNDSGASSGIPAPSVEASVSQRCTGSGVFVRCEFSRTLQGNALQFTGLFRSDDYTVTVREFGGQERRIAAQNRFPLGSAASPLSLVLPAFGDVRVRVDQAGRSAANARVTVSGNGSSAAGFTDSTGTALIRGIRLGPISVQAVTLDGAFSGSTTGTLSSQSTPAEITITLGSYAGITGFVEAESGGPSAGTRVTASFGRILEVFTDSSGSYVFQGIPTGSSSAAVALSYIGPDGTTVGGRQTVAVTTADASRLITVPSVKLDATPPQILSITPSDGSTRVSPDTKLKVIFSERVDPAKVTNSFFTLTAVDTNVPVATGFLSEALAGGGFSVMMIPPPPTAAQQAAGQLFPLRSNTLYRLVVSGDITDLTGHKLPATRGVSFVTSDYAEPRVIRITPALDTPLQAATTFEFKFNEPVDPAPWAAGGAGVMRLFKIHAAGPAGSVLAEKPGRFYVGPSGDALVFAPNDPIEGESFYRLVFSGIRDLQGNPLLEQTFHFFSFDSVKPHVLVVSPVPAGFPLVSGVEYVVGVDLRNGSASGPTAVDVARVDYLRVEGSGAIFLTTASRSPFTYRFVAPESPAGGISTTWTIRAIATDLSGNVSQPAEMTWNVAPNLPPARVAVSLNPSGSIYAGKRIGLDTTFEDEGTQVTVQATLTALRSDGTTFTMSKTLTSSRTTVAASWSAAHFDFDLPPNLKESSPVSFEVRVTDARGQQGTGAGSVDVLVDAINPVIDSLTPASESRFTNGSQFSAAVIVTDVGAGVSEVTFTIDGQIIRVPAGDSRVTDGSIPGSKRFTSGPITVPTRNVDSRIAVIAAARDYHGNTVSRMNEVVYVGVNDPARPRGSWLCPADRSALPANQPAFPARLRVEATDDISVTGVNFYVPGSASPIPAVRVGLTSVYEAQAAVSTPAAGESLVLRAVISDADPTHDVELTVTVDAVQIDLSIDDRIQAVLASDIPAWTGKSVLVRGPTARLVLHAPITLANLILLDGGKLESLRSTTSQERKLDLTILDHLTIDCSSSIDVTGAGYLGGWEQNPDGSGTRNESAQGRTIGNVSEGGATKGASASHAGLGGEAEPGTAGNVYDSLFSPADLGSGGGGATVCCQRGAAGGGAIRIRGGDLPGNLSRFAISGAIRADGGSGVGVAGAGSGGSIDIRARTIVVPSLSQVSASGGDDDEASNSSRGGGGGRIAIAAGERFEVSDSAISARGGRNGTGSAVTSLDGGAGTMLLRRPGQLSGTLIVSSFDGSTTTRQTRATPIGQIGSGISSALTPSSLSDSTRVFGRGAVSQELLVGNPSRAFTVIDVSGDGRTLMTDPADGDLVITAGGSAVPYQGAVRFDGVTAGPRALVRSDDRLLIGDTVDDRARVSLAPSSVILLKGDAPGISLQTSVAPNASLPADAVITATYDATSLAGVSRVEVDWTPIAVSPALHSQHPLTTGPRTVSLSVPATTQPSPIILKLRAFDRAGRSTETSAVAFNVVPNLPPRIDRFDIEPVSLQMYPGRAITATVSAADDLAVRSLAFSTQIGSAPVATQVVDFNQPAVTNHRFTFAVPIDTPGGQTLSLSLSASDMFPSRPPVVQTATVAILRDAVAPQLTHLSPAAATVYDEGSGATIPVRVVAADAEVGVKSVSVQVGSSAPIALAPDGSPNTWAVQLPIPSVDGSEVVAFQLTVTARDYEGNATIGQPVSIGVRPLFDPNAPVIQWSCSGNGAMYPAGFALKLRVNAIGNAVGNTTNAVQKVEFFAGSSATPIAGVAVAGLPNEYQAVYTIPADAAAESTFAVKAVVTNVASKVSDLTTTITVVAGQRFSGNSTISDSTFDGRTIIVDSGILIITGARSFDRVIVLEGAAVTHPPTDASTIHRLEITARQFFVACGGSIDATGKGFSGAVQGAGRTWPNTTTGGSVNAAGGSHGGRGGVSDSSFVGGTYGTLFDPSTPGSAGGFGNRDCNPCNHGGGVIRLSGTQSMAVEGSVISNGFWSSAGSAGAGGSIRVQTPLLRGLGKISAEGGRCGDGNGSGGGGRVAVEAASLLLPREGITAWGGSGVSPGAAGTVFLKSGSQINGELIVDNGSRTTQSVTTMPGVGFAVADEVGAGFVRDIGGQFAGPDHLRGLRLILGSATNPSWPILGNDAETIRISAVPALTVQSGQTVRGLYRFDALRLRNARVETIDLLEVSTAIDKDAASTITSGNLRAPVIDSSRISLATSSLGHAVVGTPGAVVDPDPPVILTLTNTRSGLATLTTVNPDGSFIASASGNAGDALTLIARDSHRFPLTSASVAAGVLPSTIPSATEMSRTGWTTDTNFRARLLAFEGPHLVVASRPEANGTLSSDKLAIFDISNPAAPQFRQTIATGLAPTRDLVVRGGWAYVVGDGGLSTVQLSSNPAVLRTPANSWCGGGRSVAVHGSYAYLGTTCTNGRVVIYDVSDPSAPRFLRDATTVNGIGYTALQPLGTNFLVGVSPDRPAGVGHDLVVINKRDIGNLIVIADLDIPSFDATRGRVEGSLVYLISDRSAQLAVVDLSNPAAPVIRSVSALPSSSTGLDVALPEIFVAGLASGVGSVNVANPQSPVTTGSLPTSGPAWDVAANGTRIYIAANDGLVTAPASLAPRITPSLVSISLSGTMASVTAAPASVSGQAPLTVEVRNERSGASVSGLAVAADGSFQTLLAAGPGDGITVKATDGAGRTAGPVSVGSVPFGTSTSSVAIPQSMVLGDVNFRARMLASEGSHLIVASRPDANGAQGSDKLVLFDITSPGSPLFRQTVGTTLSAVRDLVIRNGWAYVLSEGGIQTVELNVTLPVVRVPSNPWCGNGRSLGVEGTYAFIGTSCSNGRVAIYDVTDPAAPRYLRDTTTVSGIAYTGMIPLGTNYLIGISPDRPSGIGHDVVVIDRRDVNNLVVVADLDVPAFDAQRARLEGSLLYLLNESSGLAIVDLSNPQSPVVRSVTAIAGPSRGFDVAGSAVAVAVGQGGVSIVDASSAPPVIRGSQILPGSSWDARYQSTVLYVATESGISVIRDVGSPPRINPSAIRVSWTGTGASVLGAAASVSGQAPMTVEVRNERSGASVSGLAVAADGSFQTLLAAGPGDGITVKATDGAGRTAGPVSVGSVPFGTSTSSVAIPQSMVLGDANFRARMLASEGSHLIVASRPDANGAQGSDKLVLFDITSPGSPLFRQTVGTTLSAVRDMVIRNGWAYVLSEGGIQTVELNVTPPVVRVPSKPWCGTGRSLGVEGTYAFIGNSCTNGRVAIYDVTDPAAPRYLRETTTVNGIVYTGMIPLGTNYLIGISPDRPSGIGHDVVVMDRRDVNNLVVVADLDVPAFDAQRARLEGSLLYLFSETGGVAVVDIVNPRAPFLVSRISAQATARGLDVNGGWVALAQGTLGVSFTDSTSTPVRQMGSHRTGSNSWDVLLRRGVLYVAEETRLSVVAEVFAPPTIDGTLVGLTPSGATANISGAAGSVRGVHPLTVRLDNRATSASVSGIAVTPAGSFSGSIAAGPGDAITVTVTDGQSRSTTRAAGSLPFGLVTTVAPASPAQAAGDVNFKARRIAVENLLSVVSGGSNYGTTLTLSDKMLVYIQSAAGGPAAVQNITVGQGGIRDVTLRSDWAYVAANNFAAVNLRTIPPTVHVPADQISSEIAVAVEGATAFTSTDNGSDGRIRIWNIANPATPLFMGEKTGLVAGVVFRKLIPLGTTHLIAITPDKPGGTGHDVVIANRVDLANLAVVADLDVPAFDAIDGTIDGTTLYLVGGDAGVAIIDLTVLTSPQTLAVIDTPGIARGVAVASSTEVVVADSGGPGLTFIDTSDRRRPRVVGSQTIPGNAVDLKITGRTIHAATDHHRVTVVRP